MKSIGTIIKGDQNKLIWNRWSECGLEPDPHAVEPLTKVVNQGHILIIRQTGGSGSPIIVDVIGPEASEYKCLKSVFGRGLSR